jgi:hypothetical protein
MKFYRYLSTSFLLSTAIFLSPLQAMDESDKDVISSLQATHFQEGLLQKITIDLHSQIIACFNRMKTRDDNYNAGKKCLSLKDEYEYDEYDEYYNNNPDKKGEILKYFKLAAHAGHPDAQYMLAGWYEFLTFPLEANGTTYEWMKLKIFPSDDADLVRGMELRDYYYTLAADQGHREAQYKLGELYDNRKNYALAIKYYELAAAQGHSDAQYFVDQLYEKKTRP